MKLICSPKRHVVSSGFDGEAEVIMKQLNEELHLMGNGSMWQTSRMT
jgi:hypothetical protein